MSKWVMRSLLKNGRVIERWNLYRRGTQYMLKSVYDGDWRIYGTKYGGKMDQTWTLAPGHVTAIFQPGIGRIPQWRGCLFK